LTWAIAAIFLLAYAGILWLLGWAHDQARRTLYMPESWLERQRRRP
jgi:hypothetical protein